MSKKAPKLPTDTELAFYRSKIETGAHIGTRQLAAVFATLDDAVARASEAETRLKLAEGLLHMAETVFGPRTRPGPERIVAARVLMDAMREAGYEVDPPR